MSESREKKLRYNRKMEFMAKFDDWYNSEPPLLFFIAWIKWLRRRPRLEHFDL